MQSLASCLGIGGHELVAGFVRNADPGVGLQRVGQANHGLQRHAPAAKQVTCAIITCTQRTSALATLHAAAKLPAAAMQHDVQHAQHATISS